jgi:hypothetical protein
MGESKRRKTILGEQYGQAEKIVSWLPVTKTQSEEFVKITTTGAWVGIGGMVVLWATIRFIGPFFGWWTLAG